MADVTSLVLAVDSRSARAAADDLDKLTAAGRRTEGAAATIARSFRGLGAALGVVSAGAVVRAAVEQADAFTNLNARLRLVTASAGEFATAQVRVFEIAQSTRTGLADTATLFGNLARSTEGLGKSQQEVLGVTEAINQAIQVSGTNAQGAAAALVQLGQGFASGTLRGEELNSVLEQAPRLAKAIADGLGVPIGQLRKLGEEGKLTAEKVFGALQKSAGTIDAEFKRLPLTVSSASTQAANALQKLIGTVNEVSGATNGLASVVGEAAVLISELADEIRKVSEGAESANLLANAFVIASEALRIFGANVAFVFGGVGREIGAVAAQIAALARLDIQGFRAISDAVTEDAKRARAELDALEQRIARRAPAVEALDTRAEDARFRASIPRQASGGGVTGKKRDPYAEEVKSLREKIALLGTVTELEKISVQIQLGNFGKLSAAQRDRLKALAAEYDARKAIADIAEAQAGIDIGRVKRQLDSLTGAYAAAESILDAQRQAGLADERQYTAAKIALVNLGADAQVRALEQENAALASQKKTGLELLQIQEQIADNEAKIATIRAQASAQIEVFAIQQVGAANAARKAIEDTNAALQGYLDTLRRGQQLDLDGLGLGNRERDRRRQRADIEDSFEQRRQELLRSRRDAEFAGTFGPEQQRQYDAELAAINRFQQKALQSFDDYYKELTRKQGDFTLGAAEAVNNYLADTENALERSQKFFEGLFDRAEDALAKFIETGKFSVKGLGDFIAQELSRATARNLLAEVLGSLKAEDGKGGILDGLGAILGPIFGGGGLRVPGIAGGQIDLGKTTADTAATAATTALTGALTASSASAASLTAAETAAAAAIATASASSAAALTALATAAGSAAAALTTVGGSSAASSAFGFLDLGFDQGGFTGAGGRKEPAGIVHKGEIVWSQDDIRRAGGAAVVETMRRGARMYDTGGPVAYDAPPAPMAGISVGGLTVNVQGNADRRSVEQIRVAVGRGLADAARRRSAG